MEIVIEGYDKDPEDQRLLTSLSLHLDGELGFQLVNSVIRWQGKIWLGHHLEAQQAILLALHSIGLGGHSGITATRVKNLLA